MRIKVGESVSLAGVPKCQHKPPQPLQCLEDEAQQHEPVVVASTSPRIDDECCPHVVGNPKNDLAHWARTARRQQAQEVQEPEQFPCKGAARTFTGLPLAAEYLRVGVAEAPEVPAHTVGPRVVGHSDEHREGVL